MRTARLLGVTAVVLAGTGVASGQVPAAPPLPAAPVAAPALPAVPGVGGVGVPAAAAAPPRNIWSFFLMTPEQKLAQQQKHAICRAQFCRSRVGGFVNGLLAPASALSGGLIGPICPDPATTPNATDLAKPATSPEGAAARIKQEEAQVAAKVAAIEYLGTVDCRYYPEAEAALIVGLRAEKNECVRLAAAKALASGCCCTPKLVKALFVTVNCSTEDGFPAEASELVRAFAYVALQRCLRKCVAADEEPPPEPPAAAKAAVYQTLAPFGTPADPATAVVVASYFTPGRADDPATVYADARGVLAKGLNLSPHTITRLNGPRNVRDAVAPGYEPSRPADLMGKLDPRGLLPDVTWVKTLPPAAGATTALPGPRMPYREAGRGNLRDLFNTARRR